MKPLVSVVSIETYEEQALSEALGRLLKPLGGIGTFTSKTGTTLIKPNLLRAIGKEAGVTTHPAIIKVIGEMIIKEGGRPIVADSPGSGYPFSEGKLREVYLKTGIAETKLPLNTTTSYSIVENPAGRFIKRFEIMDAVLDADSIINIAKLKTHSLTTITGAVKNMFGVIPGRIKIGYHGRFETEEGFARMLLDLVRLVRPRLSIIDAVIGMEGNGPNRGTPVKLGFIAASEDPIALDLVSAYLVGAGIEKVPHLKIAVEEGLIPPSIDDLDIVSDSSLAHIRKEIKLPVTVTTHYGVFALQCIKAVLKPLFKKFLTVKPIVISDICTACGVCERACPSGAIKIVGSKGKKYAKIDDNLCIRCYCCHEQCEHGAIDLKKPLLASWAGIK